MKWNSYKPTQGRYARYSVAVAAAALLLFAAWRITRFLGAGPGVPVIGLDVPYGAFWGAGFFILFGSLCALLLSGIRTGIKSVDAVSSAFVDLLIDTEHELQKVAWPNREEVRRYTIVVIACTLIIAGFILAVDFIVSHTMSGVGVLPI